MTAVGERTKRMQLGTSVLTPTFRYNPAVIAQAFATMGCLYPNRIFLGVGTGEALNEVATGYQGVWPEFKERFARLRESVRLMRELWRGDRVDFDGEYYRLRGASIYDVPEGECRSTPPRAVRRWPSMRAVPATVLSAPPARARTSTARS
ncbi:F420-dependent glucose-6-phosphate dehydrogenase [Mycobacterium ulcerans str. Harvey]|uniref:F420-dependent glucose-6-phosphate dehydrogenase n=1 Tax=Mycobacterium ulcerans str. Harvey TaxID=1299332 RepID=A0ABP3AFP2_MYCUL|nr:F420-dependent glucose-6-phosphate dehydrogenase [Mycobacterium ulcerans str. Harvey]